MQKNAVINIVKIVLLGASLLVVMADWDDPGQDRPPPLARRAADVADAQGESGILWSAVGGPMKAPETVSQNGRVSGTVDRISF